jgi:hypothetical protein
LSISSTFPSSLSFFLLFGLFLRGLSLSSSSEPLLPESLFFFDFFLGELSSDPSEPEPEPSEDEPFLAFLAF